MKIIVRAVLEVGYTFVRLEKLNDWMVIYKLLREFLCSYWFVKNTALGIFVTACINARFAAMSSELTPAVVDVTC